MRDPKWLSGPLTNGINLMAQIHNLENDNGLL